MPDDPTKYRIPMFKDDIPHVSSSETDTLISIFKRKVEEASVSDTGLSKSIFKGFMDNVNSIFAPYLALLLNPTVKLNEIITSK